MIIPVFLTSRGKYTSFSLMPLAHGPLPIIHLTYYGSASAWSRLKDSFTLFWKMTVSSFTRTVSTLVIVSFLFCLGLSLTKSPSHLSTEKILLNRVFFSHCSYLRNERGGVGCNQANKWLQSTSKDDARCLHCCWKTSWSSSCLGKVLFTLCSFLSHLSHSLFPKPLDPHSWRRMENGVQKPSISIWKRSYYRRKMGKSDRVLPRCNT